MELKYSPYRRFAASRREQSERGFTLIEVLIVVSIIAILATMTFAGVQIAQRQARNAQAKSEVANFCQSIDMYYTDEKTYPGRTQKQIDSDTNQFPDVYFALLDDAAPEGRGGRNSPYIKLERERVVIENEDWDEDTDEADTRWVTAKRSQLTDSKVDKYYLDPFRTFSVYIYRCNKGRKPKNWMLNTRGYDFYSIGPDEQDDTVLGDEEEDEENESDDVSNS
tara:strand:+ start:4180 stop:4848 length:669 start_codon:yes stop_codon:yes gene_type:complete